MRISSRWLAASAGLWLGLPLVAVAQQGNTVAAPNNAAQQVVPDNRPFDRRDFSGVWRGDKYGFNANYEPPMTPEGRKKFEANKPSYGYMADGRSGPGFNARRLTSEELSKIPSGRRRAIPPAQGNDYAGTCNPLGLIRMLLYSPSPMEMIMTPNRIVQQFEWTWDHREIWLDGRALPKVEEYLPRWAGYSVGRWEGDTLVVTSVGMDDRAWVDHFGYPISSQARLEERWRRPAYNILQLDLTLIDPLTYTEPWKSETSTFRLYTNEILSASTGWVGIAEDRCVPLDEVEQFNQRIRNPAGGVTSASPQ